MSESSQVLLQHFKARKSEKDRQAIQEARRVVNLYRSLSCFGEDFIPIYNQMLLAVKPNVKRLLRNFMGGEEVEDYLEFLQENAHLSKAEVEQKNADNPVQMKKGYLPDPEFDLDGTAVKMVKVPQTEWEKMQTSAVSKSSLSFKNMRTPSTEKYSEIIEEGSGEKEHE